MNWLQRLLDVLFGSRSRKKKFDRETRFNTNQIKQNKKKQDASLKVPKNISKPKQEEESQQPAGMRSEGIFHTVLLDKEDRKAENQMQCTLPSVQPERKKSTAENEQPAEDPPSTESELCVQSESPSESELTVEDTPGTESELCAESESPAKSELTAEDAPSTESELYVESESPPENKLLAEDVLSTENEPCAESELPASEESKLSVKNEKSEKERTLDGKPPVVSVDVSPQNEELQESNAQEIVISSWLELHAPKGFCWFASSENTFLLQKEGKQELAEDCEKTACATLSVKKKESICFPPMEDEVWREQALKAARLILSPFCSQQLPSERIIEFEREGLAAVIYEMKRNSDDLATVVTAVFLNKEVCLLVGTISTDITAEQYAECLYVCKTPLTE